MARRSDWPDTLTPAAVHILLALADEDRHGLGIVDEVERRTGGEVKLGPGTLYGTIKRMREAGLIQEPAELAENAESDTRRRYYRITELGRDALRAEARRLERLVVTARQKAVLEPVEE
jgi:DNA-binding PadR family transcriptional regulator